MSSPLKVVKSAPHAHYSNSAWWRNKAPEWFQSKIFNETCRFDSRSFWLFGQSWLNQPYQLFDHFVGFGRFACLGHFYNFDSFQRFDYFVRFLLILVSWPSQSVWPFLTFWFFSFYLIFCQILLILAFRPVLSVWTFWLFDSSHLFDSFVRFY